MTTKFADAKPRGARWEWAQLRAASGALTGADTSPRVRCGWARLAVVRLDITTITTPDADDEVDFYVQTRFNGGDWVDLENHHLANADNGTTRIRDIVIGGAQRSAAARTETAGTLADNTKNDLPLGDELRVVCAVTGATAPTYAYNAEVFLQA